MHFLLAVGRAEAGVRSQLSFMICCTVIIHTNTPQLHYISGCSGCSYPHRCQVTGLIYLPGPLAATV